MCGEVIGGMMYLIGKETWCNLAIGEEESLAGINKLLEREQDEDSEGQPIERAVLKRIEITS